jgi:hypothetical protein
MKIACLGLDLLLTWSNVLFLLRVLLRLMIMLDVCVEEPSLMFIIYVVCMVIKIDLLFIVSVANDYN